MFKEQLRALDTCTFLRGILQDLCLVPCEISTHDVVAIALIGIKGCIRTPVLLVWKKFLVFQIALKGLLAFSACKASGA